MRVRDLTLYLDKPQNWLKIPFLSLIGAISFLAFSLNVVGARAQVVRDYHPIPLVIGSQVKNTLSDKDIPTGQGGFARDYILNLKVGDQILIELKSDKFDTIVTLIGANGTTVAENDDGPGGTTDSLLFARIVKSGNYVVRVSAFGKTGGGPFTLKVTRVIEDRGRGGTRDLGR